jgi:hypothetical protein
VRLHPEYFQIDWLHDHDSERAQELVILERKLSNLLTALLHKAQRSRRLSRPIPEAASPVAGVRPPPLWRKMLDSLRFPYDK